MAQVEFKLLLPDSLAREAEANGLWTPESIEVYCATNSSVAAALGNCLTQQTDWPTLKMPPLTEAEVDAEIQAVRNVRRTPDASGR